MKKKLASLLLALALCVSLAIPAQASMHELSISYPDGTYHNTNNTESGDGWSFNSETNTLTLNGIKGDWITVNLLAEPQGAPTIVLAPGSKNVVAGILAELVEDSDGYDITFKGSGELIIYDADPDENGVFWGFAKGVKLLDGLTMSGGTSEGDAGPLEFKFFRGEYYDYYRCMAGSAPAKYIRIAGAPSITGFSDVTAGSAYEEAIKWAVDQKITTGITANTFGPSNTCTVSNILTFLWRANGRPNESGTEKESVAAWAESLGIDTSNLGGSCTRAAAVNYMWKAAGSPAPSKAASFSDVPAAANYAQAVSWAVEKGITTGTGATTFAPDNTCTRGQIVTFLYRASK